MRKQIINLIVLVLLFVNIGTARAEQAKIATVYLDEYKRNEDGGYIPSEKEIYAFAEEKSREMGDEILDVTCKLTVDSTNSAIVWTVEIIKCDAMGDIYAFNTEAQVFMNEIWSSHPFMPGYHELMGYYRIGQKDDYCEYLRKSKKRAEFTLKWTELYGLYFTWDLERKHEYYMTTKQLPADTFGKWYTGEAPELSGWSYPSEDVESFQAEVNDAREEARREIMQHYRLSEAEMDSLIEDIQCYGQNFNLSFIYWMKARLDGCDYWIPLCRYSPKVLDLRTMKTSGFIQGLDVDIIPYIKFGE